MSLYVGCVNLGETQVAQSCTWQYPVCSPAMNADGQMLLELRHVVPERKSFKHILKLIF